jgi:hypothetical protein
MNRSTRRETIITLIVIVSVFAIWLGSTLLGKGRNEPLSHAVIRGCFVGVSLAIFAWWRRRRARHLDCEYLRSLESTLSEWNSPHDDEAFRDL